MNNLLLKAKPVWVKGMEYEKNLCCGFKAIINNDNFKNVSLKIAASTNYRFFINGEFIGFGPARTAHNFYRLDEWDIGTKLNNGENVIAIEVVGYNVNSYYTLDQPSFLQAEIVASDVVLASTNENGQGFSCGIITERVQKVQRYSFQRPFVECYRLSENYDAWRKNTKVNMKKEELIETEEKTLIERNLPYPAYNKHFSQAIIDEGSAKTGRIVKYSFNNDRSVKEIGDILKGFEEKELEIHLTDEVEKIELISQNETRIELSEQNRVNFFENSYKTFDFGVNKTGFITIDVECIKGCTIYVLFDEVLKNKRVDFWRSACANAIKLEMKKGKYKVQIFEPYTMRFLQFILLEGQCQIENIYLIEYTTVLKINKEFHCHNEKLNKIYDAAIETFKQNSVDLFTDCPSRERAGWLCDSFFIARVEYFLTGKTIMEKAFLKNYLLPDSFAFIPEDMLPMAYPTDNNDGVFIPNWAMFFVIELEEYLKRSSDLKMVFEFKDKVYKLLNYFKSFINEYGLLENLEGWVFVEWSKSNELVQDVNFPTNMVYAKCLEMAGELYNDISLINDGNKIKETIRKMSFDGEFFIDNMIRKNGQLILSGERTEACQYYAFFTDTATPQTHSKLWNVLLTKFGPNRKTVNEYEEIYFANAFIGNYLRLDTLSRYGYGKKLIEEIEGYFYYMAEKTGTLWENDSDIASCNHGFASYVALLLLKHKNEVD